MPVSEALFQEVAFADDSATWELICGRLRPKPPMTAFHNQVARNLLLDLAVQLPRDQWTAGQEVPNLRIPGGNFRTPDVCVVPVEAVKRHQREFPMALETYDEPMPLVVEVWSPSTGDYDVDTKLLEYQRRGDLEIWRIHPLERTLIAWVRQSDGTYTETLHTAGVVRPTFLPGVTIELSRLFA